MRSTVALHAFTSANDKINPTNTQKISGGQDAWKKLKDAVAAAKDGDVIIIDGTIKATNAEGDSGAIEITKKITIKGKTGTGTNMLDANSYHPDSDAPTTPHRIFTIKSGGNLTLENLTLKNGKANGSGTDQNGGGIYVGKKAECTIKGGVTIQYNGANSGGGIYVDSSDSATDPDKGELIVNGTAANPVVISNCVVTGSSSSGGGIYSKGKVTLEYAKLEHNKAQTNGQGGGIYINEYAGACELDNTTITDCEAASAGGGVYIFANRSLTLKGSTTITFSSGVDKGKGDVFLTHYAYISISGILSASQVARISMAANSYNVYTNNPVLQGDLQQGPSRNYSKFTVTPLEEGVSTKFWQINSTGKLEVVPQP